MNLFSQVKKTEIESGCRVGYWLVRQLDCKRFFISEHVSESALNKVCDKVLSEKMGWDYWVDYCMGRDVRGAIAWSNLDHTDRFI